MFTDFLAIIYLPCLSFSIDALLTQNYVKLSQKINRLYNKIISGIKRSNGNKGF